METSLNVNKESSSELRQWCYGEKSVFEYVSKVEFMGRASFFCPLIAGPFRNFVSESNASYQSLVWHDLPGTNGRYRAALAKTEVVLPIAMLKWLTKVGFSGFQ
jgi:hypothetical protein